MNTHTDQLAQFVEAHLAGRHADIPELLQEEFQQALAAHQALRSMLEETAVGADSHVEERLPPDVSADYEIECELGRGGMGVVYLARQRTLQRRVALKVLRQGPGSSGSVGKRFLEEAQHLARLRHPNIVSVYEVGDASGEPYFTMDYVEGESLAAVISRGPLSPTQAVAILKQVAAAVQHAHRQGIIHRDLKPGNVLLDRNGQVFVTDFGLARNVSNESHLTQSGELLGTPQYMAPEQARGQSALIGEATDIHALGVLLYEMLTGRPPFVASTSADLLVQVLQQEPTPLRSADRRIPRDLETICLKALQKSPAARYANVSAFLEDLRRFEAGEPLVARRTSSLVRGWRWVRKHWRIGATVLVTAAVVLAVVPPLLDRSYEDLVTWATEELQAGRPQVAAQILERALTRATPAQQEELVPLMVQTVMDLDDPVQVVNLARQIVGISPEVSFGKYDFLVAQAFVTDARAETRDGMFEPGFVGPSGRRELAALRLSLCLEGSWVTADERRDAEQTLLAIERSLRSQRPTFRYSVDQIVLLPQGTLDELQKRALDSDLTLWDRGKAAYAAGRILEAEQDFTAALREYVTAVEFMRQVYPLVGGVISQIQLSANPERSPEAPECRLMREVLAAIERLGGTASLPGQGGVRFTADHPELLEGLQAAALIQLSDPAIHNPYQGLPRHLSGYVWIPGEGEAEVSVLDGRYRLSLAGTARNWITNPDSGVRADLIEITAENWPEEIEIRGEMVRLPPLTIRQLSPVILTQPGELDHVDLSTVTLRWDPIPAAAWYQVQVGYFEDSPSPTSHWFHTVRVEENFLKPQHFSGYDLQRFQQNWTKGRLGGFRVDAFDESGRRLGTTLRERQFLIVGSLQAE